MCTLAIAEVCMRALVIKLSLKPCGNIKVQPESKNRKPEGRAGEIRRVDCCDKKLQSVCFLIRKLGRRILSAINFLIFTHVAMGFGLSNKARISI